MRTQSALFLALSSVILFGIAASLSTVATLDAMPKSTKADLMKRGKVVYNEYCKTCHQADGKGIEGVYPPVAKSDFLKKNRKRNIQNILFGLSGEITVNGKKYNGVMTPIPDKYDDKDVAAVLTYVYNSFGNRGPVVQPEEVAKVRAEGNPDASSSKKKKKKKKK